MLPPTLIRLALLPLLGLLAGGCTALSIRPQNTFRTLFHLPIGSAQNSPEQVEALLDECTDSRSIPGNQVIALQNGDETFPQMLQAIDSARCRVAITTYDFRGDDTGRQFVAAMERALDRGVEVRLIYDAIGSKEVRPDILNPLLKKGLQLRIFNPTSSWTVLRFNNRSHRKILVADGRTAIIGGLNLGDPYAGNGFNGWRDMALRVDGPAAAEAERIFAQGWNQAGAGWFGKNLPFVGLHWLKQGLDYPFVQFFHATYTPPAYGCACLPAAQPQLPANDPAGEVGDTPGNIPVRVVEQSPEWTDGHLLNLHLALINSARSKVYITSPYFVPPASLERALVTAAARGVDVRILTQEKTDENLVRTLSHGCLESFVKEGVKIYGWDRSILHAKELLVDDRWISIGSCNLDGRALFLNYEANFVVSDPDLSKKLSEQFLKDIALSRQYTLNECMQMRCLRSFFWLPLRGQF